MRAPDAKKNHQAERNRKGVMCNETRKMERGLAASSGKRAEGRFRAFILAAGAAWIRSAVGAARQPEKTAALANAAERMNQKPDRKQTTNKRIE